MGSIIKDYGNGKYRVQICNGFKADGKVNRMTKTLTAKNKTDLKNQMNTLEVDFRCGAQQTKIKEHTFVGVVEKWKEIELPKIRTNTADRYLDIIDKKLLTAFGNRKLDAIRVLDVEEYLHSLTLDGSRLDGKSGGYAQKTILHHYVILNLLFNCAVKWEYMSVNPCSKIDRPKVDKQEAHFMTKKA